MSPLLSKTVIASMIVTTTMPTCGQVCQDVSGVFQVGQVREVEVKAARAEGVNDARHVASQQRAGLQQDQQERLQQLQAQEQQVCCSLNLSNTVACIRHA